MRRRDDGPYHKAGSEYDQFRFEAGDSDAPEYCDQCGKELYTACNCEDSLLDEDSPARRAPSEDRRP